MSIQSVVVVGGTRGLGLAVAQAFRSSGARVVTVARGASDVTGDATDETLADKVLTEHRPDLLVITAGAVPPMHPLTEHTWESFSANWHSDVRIAYTWLRSALRVPLRPGSRVVVFGSAAELHGSPLSGGYAGAKATVRLITRYAAAEGANLGLTMTTVLPVITPGTTIGDTAISSYGPRPGPTPSALAASVVSLVAGDFITDAYVADPEGRLQPLVR
ncbi:SDR family NAD(P)-dependent oxidoreductase [Paractinoplanes lichenicola]|uniref:SDR family oxidoreductase n=1 Tax=Paractinoplanes lichenicola TaxID=2802976 RepID=A0ABS1VDN1_9ACTN|nr:SDR family oxidoreductase [Actinoplanes lichenicola]MBL7252771.1 SDR family oxidoreductase [Actinoplanes lichenicola]